MRRIHKKISSILLSLVMGITLLPTAAFAQDNQQEQDEVTEVVEIEDNETSDEELSEDVTEMEMGATSSPITINLWSYTDEVPMMVQRYIDKHPDCGFKIKVTVVSSTGGYPPALEQALMQGGANAPDIYTVDYSSAYKYFKGEASNYAMPYKDLGIDIDAKIQEADIASYAVEVGTNAVGDVVGLGYQSSSGAFVYRRSIAKKTWGTDDPSVIAKKIGAGTGNLDAFWTAAEDLKAKGYAIVSGSDDLWRVVENSADQGWVVNEALNIDPKREAFLDYAKKLKTSGYSNDSHEWSSAWFDDMAGQGDKQVLGFFGPAWAVNYTLAPNCGGSVVGEGTYGDWAVCESPIGFYWGGTWVAANKFAPTEKRIAIRKIIEWITLDCTEDGLQYMWANGIFSGTKDAVASGTVMAMSDGSNDFLSGQNMFDVYINANHMAKGTNGTLYDSTINSVWIDNVQRYVDGDVTRQEAIQNFKSNVADVVDFTGSNNVPEYDPVIPGGTEEPEEPEIPDDPDAVIINLCSYTDELYTLVQKYIEMHPDCGFRINPTIISTTDGAYQPYLNWALDNGGKDAPDIYVTQDAFTFEYAKGYASDYAMPYKDLGIDIEAKLKAADIAPYTVDMGSNNDGDVVGLTYESTSGAFIYRRSIAKDIWGTDDPSVVAKKIGGGTGNLDAFWDTAEVLKQNGYAILSGYEDLWSPVCNSADQGWVVEGKPYIDPKREAFLDYSKKLRDGGYTNNSTQWTKSWFDDMCGMGDKDVFGFFGPAWFLQMTLAPNSSNYVVGNGTYGDWAVCEPPMGFYQGGTYVFANKYMPSEKIEAVKTIIEWITLDCTKDGLQYMFANGLFDNGKDAVPSGTVMAMSDGTLDFLGGQDMFDAYIKANHLATGANCSPHDEVIGYMWKERVEAYVNGEKTKEDAITDFIVDVRYTFGLFGGSGGSGGEVGPNPIELPEIPDDPNAVIINLWSFTDEVEMIIQQYIAEHPDCGFRINSTIVPTIDGDYQLALDQALMQGGANAPDIYATEAGFTLKYTQGEAAAYAAPYKDFGIDINAKIKEADIAQYSVDIGTNKKGDVVGLGYQSTSGAFIYRRSIAKDVWGTDDPNLISEKIGGGTGNLDTFRNAAEALKKKGYAIISSSDDLWYPVENSADKPWVVNGALTIDPKREAFLDYSMKLRNGGYTNNTMQWQDAWFVDMKGEGQKEVFGFFGPAWLVNYTLAPNCGDTYGDWAVCESPLGFSWGGTWILANKNVSDKKREAVKTIIEWITLDCSEDGYQYKLANGQSYAAGGMKDVVPSSTVMANSDGSLDFLGGQNMYDVYIKANHSVKGTNVTLHDEVINSVWRDQAREYASGYKTREDAIADFKTIVAELVSFDEIIHEPSTWYKEDNKWYYYDSNCEMQTGWAKIGGKWYYFGNDGVMVTGWKKIGTVWYYFDGGVMVSGWKKIGNVWYYFDGGAMATGWKKISNVWYYFDDGAMVSGWKKISNKWYYFDGGAMTTGWKKISNKWYYFDGGVMATGWKKISNKWYYFDGGVMAASKWINDTYYVKADGTMAMNEWIGKYYVDANGKYVKGARR